MKTIQRICLLGAISLLPIWFIGCSGTPKVLYETMQPIQEAFTSTEIPLRFERGMPCVTVEVDSQAIELGLDTGANHVTLGFKPEIINRLTVRHVGGLHGLMSNYGISLYRKFIVPEVKIADLTYSELLCDKDAIRDGSPAPNGLMGLELLKEFNVLIDYQGAAMVLYRGDLLPEDEDLNDWQKISFMLDDTGILLSGTFEGSDRELTFLVDTGSVGRGEHGETFNAMKGTMRAKLDQIPIEEMSGYGVAWDQRLMFGEEKLSGLNFIFVESFTKPASLNGGTLGNDFFLKYKVFFDFANHQMYVKQYA